MRKFQLDQKYGHLKYMTADQVAGKEDAEPVDHQEIVRKNQLDIQDKLQALNEEFVYVTSEELEQQNYQSLVTVQGPQDDDDLGEGGTIIKTLQNSMHIAYLGDIFLGTTPNNRSQPASVIFDTATQYLAVTSTQCKACRTHVYDASSSKTVNRQIYSPQHEYYGSSELFGEQIQDLVCLYNIETDF